MASTDLAIPAVLDSNPTACASPPVAGVLAPLGAVGRVEGHGTTLLRVACLLARELAALELIAIDQRASGTQVMSTMRDKFKKSELSSLLNLMFLFRQQALLEGNIRAV